MATSVLKLLQKREQGPFSSQTQKQLVDSVNTISISLTKIADWERRILRGHVVLGFTRSGSHLLSYLCTMNEKFECSYSLHWWAFDMWKPLEHVCRRKLFCHTVIKDEMLHLVVCQNPDGKHVTVVARDISEKEEGKSRLCLVSIFPDHTHDHAHHNAAQLSESFSLHINFDLLSPYPTFVPSLCLKLPACVIINTGDTLVGVRYSIQPESSARPCSAVWCGLEPGRRCCCYTQQVFVSPGSGKPSFNDIGHSPSRLLPVEVYHKRRPLRLAGPSCTQQSSTHSTSDHTSSVAGPSSPHTPDHTTSRPDHTFPPKPEPCSHSHTASENPLPEPSASQARPDRNSTRPHRRPKLTTILSCISPYCRLPVPRSSPPIVPGAITAAGKRQCVVVEQSCLDIELWLNATLEKELTKNGTEFRTLADYDVQIVEVSEAQIAVFIIVAKGEIMASSERKNFIVRAVGYWQISKGTAELRGISKPVLYSCPLQDVKLPKIVLHQGLILADPPSLPSKSVRTFSNHTVFSGESLSSLRHPILPVVLVLTET